MKKLAATALVTLALVGGSVAIAPAASAASGCVTKSEYKKAKKGMTKAKVAKIFGTNGKRDAYATSGGYASEIRSYRTCSAYSAVSIAFDKVPGGTLRLSAKSAVWVS